MSEPAAIVKKKYEEAKELGSGIYEEVTEDPFKTALAVSTLGASAVIEKGYSEVKGKMAKKKAETIRRQTAKTQALQTAFEKEQTEKELSAKRKAAEERLARRKGVPGRPIFTQISDRPSLLG